jgi:hypothetical protein
MGAIMNGIALHGGTRVYGGTFLTFSDYQPDRQLRAGSTAVGQPRRTARPDTTGILPGRLGLLQACQVGVDDLAAYRCSAKISASAM